MAATAVPLPPGMLQFVDGNGAPYANGLVYTYIPATTTPKTTWQDPAQTIPNANPITLDANGRAAIWGSGQYRQQLFDQFGNLVWDQLTEAADPNYVISLASPFTGDSGAGGTQGLVPAPAAGNAAAGFYLAASGVWAPLTVVVPAAPAPNQAGLLFLPTRTITTTSGTLGPGDVAGNVSYANAGAGTLTVANDANAPWITGALTQIQVSNRVGSGNLTLHRDGGVTLLWPGSSASSADRTLAANGQCVLTRIDTNTWTVVGAGLS